jgi:hypothetical protein
MIEKHWLVRYKYPSGDWGHWGQWKEYSIRFFYESAAERTVDELTHTRNTDGEFHQAEKVEVPGPPPEGIDMDIHPDNGGPRWWRA